MSSIDIRTKARILEAALSEFAVHGYERANTNTICLTAGVSKGLIFHYFDSKRRLFLAAAEKCIGETTEHFTTLAIDDPDFTSTLLAYYRLRAEYFSHHPFYYRMLTQCMTAPPPELRARIEKLLSGVTKLGESVLLKNFEKVPLKKTVNRHTALSLLIVVLNAIEGKYLPVLLGGGISAEQYDRIEAECGELIRLVLYGIAEES